MFETFNFSCSDCNFSLCRQGAEKFGSLSGLQFTGTELRKNAEIGAERKMFVTAVEEILKSKVDEDIAEFLADILEEKTDVEQKQRETSKKEQISTF